MSVRREADTAVPGLVAVVVIAVLALVGFGISRLFVPKPAPQLPPQPQMVIQEGVVYPLLSYSIALTPVGETPVKSYVFTVSYPDGTGHGSVAVPKMAALRDSTLEPNTVIWEPKITMEGREYQVVRYNPTYEVRALERPVVSANPKPLER